MFLNLWNSLPQGTAMASSLGSFGKELDARKEEERAVLF